MADAVSTTVIRNDYNFYTVHLTNLSDGTGESAVVKVDKSTISPEPTSLALASARWNIQGFTKVQLLWDHTTDVTIMLLSGSGYEDFDTLGGSKQDVGTGGTGDVLLTTTGTTSGNTYDITLAFRKIG
jgi:hypothetical protein